MEKQEIIKILKEVSQHLGGIDEMYAVNMSCTLDRVIEVINRHGTVIGKDIEVVYGGPCTIVEYQ